MITKEIAEAAVEINVILDNLSNDVINKIPNNIIKFFKDNASDSYNFVYDKNKKLNEQNLKLETRGIIAYIYKEYICAESEREDFEQLYRTFILDKEEQKTAFDPNKLFKEKNIKPKYQYTMPVEKVKDKWYVKIFKSIKSLFLK